MIDAPRADLHDETCYVSLSGTGALVCSLAVLLDVRFGHTVMRVVHSGRHWIIERNGTDVARADFLTLTLPAPELSALFHSAASVSLQETITPVYYAPCWTLMMGFAQPLGLPYDGIRTDDDVLAWTARDNSKPGRAMVDESWVVHAPPGRSAVHAQDAPERAVYATHVRFAEAFPDMSQPDVMVAHLWPYALVEQPAGVPHRQDATARLSACGDWYEGLCAEVAFLGGIAPTAKVARTL